MIIAVETHSPRCGEHFGVEKSALAQPHAKLKIYLTHFLWDIQSTPANPDTERTG